jgi:hypothetical protein
MADIQVKKSLLFSGGTTEAINVALATAGDAPLPEATPPLQLSFGATASAPVKIGGADEAKLSIASDAMASLTPIFSTNAASNADKLKAIAAADYFDGKNADRLLLLLDLGASVAVEADASTQAQPLRVGAELKIGVDSTYRYGRSFQKTTKAKDVLEDFFSDLTVPAALRRRLFADEVLVFEFGGAASFGLKASAGYKLAGSRAFNLGDLGLSETYAFSLLGEVKLTADFGGRFAIDVRPAATGADQGWAHIRVRKNEKRSFGIAAELKAGASFTTTGLPATADEFLEATLGLRAKNWISYFKRAQQLTDPKEVKAMLDKLADSFIEKWLGKAFSRLETPEATAFFAKIKAALASYDQLGDKAVTLFDRYYDPVAGAVTPALELALEKIQQLQSLADLKGQVLDSPLSEVLTILTEGRLLDFIDAGAQKLDELKKEVEKVLELVKTGIPNAAHQELRDLIATAKKEFGLDKLADLLRQADPAKLKSIADQRIVGFAERLIGRTVDSISGSAIGHAAKEINDILGGIETFKTKFYDKLLDAVKQSFSLALHAGYNTSSGSDNLVECDLNLDTATGRELMAQAGRAQFEDLLTTVDPSVVRNIDGKLLRSIARQTTVSINLTGWHDHAFQYQSIREMVVNADQHVKSTPGGLAVSTDVELAIRTKAPRNNERLMTTFILNTVGLSKAGATLDPATKQFLIDEIGAMTASYQLVREDQSTSVAELTEYLALAPELGFNLGPDLADAAKRLLPVKDGNVGEVTVTYDVKFTEAGLRAIFSKPVGNRAAWEQQLRQTMRNLLLVNYLGRRSTHHFDIGWAYWSQSTFLLWQHARAVNVNEFIAPGPGGKSFAITGTSPLRGVTRPSSVVLDAAERRIVDVLYQIEQLTVAAFSALLDLKPPFTPAAYQNALAKFGDALDLYDRFDEGDNTILAILDRLIQLSGVQDARSALLTVKATLDAKTVTKVLPAS